MTELQEGGTVEYRVMIERPGVHGPSAAYRQDARELAEFEQRRLAEHYAKTEPGVRVWLESRTTSPWEPLA